MWYNMNRYPTCMIPDSRGRYKCVIGYHCVVWLARSELNEINENSRRHRWSELNTDQIFTESLYARLHINEHGRIGFI